MEENGDRAVRLSMMRRTIAKRMKTSWETSPRVTYHTQVDATGMAGLRARANASVGEVKLSHNHIIMKAVAVALGEMPEINASITDRELLIHPEINIGLAVSVPGGLVVPNIKDCGNKPLLRLARETGEKIQAVRAGNITPEDMAGATFTVTNLGRYGITAFSPIINQPELAILGVGAIVDTPVAVDGQVVVRPVMGLSLTADHRAVDGAEAAKFLARIRELLERPGDHPAFCIEGERE